MSNAEKVALTPEELDAMYSRNLDDVPEMPGFPLPKPGVYHLRVKEQGLKEINDSRAHEFKYEVVEVLEESDTLAPEAKSCVPGDQFSQLYFMTTQKAIDFNWDRIVKLLQPVKERFGSKTFPQMCEAYVGCEIRAIVALRQNKEKKEQWFPEIKEMELV